MKLFKDEVGNLIDNNLATVNARVLPPFFKVMPMLVKKYSNVEKSLTYIFSDETRVNRVVGPLPYIKSNKFTFILATGSGYRF